VSDGENGDSSDGFFSPSLSLLDPDQKDEVGEVSCLSIISGSGVDTSLVLRNLVASPVGEAAQAVFPSVLRYRERSGDRFVRVCYTHIAERDAVGNLNKPSGDDVPSALMHCDMTRRIELCWVEAVS